MLGKMIMDAMEEYIQETASNEKADQKIVDKVNKVMRTVVEANDKVLKDPAPFVALLRQDASALVFVVRAWVQSSDYWNVYFYLCENMKKAFDTMGIEIPFNQLDVHFDKEQ